MSYTYNRRVHFQDTDAAGVVYFANVLAMCHEAYEASLIAAGIPLKSFFNDPAVAIPVVHASVDFFRPMFCGDSLLIHLVPQLLSDTTFEIAYQIVASGSEPVLAKALTRHVCINPMNRMRTQLPEATLQWLEDWQGDR